MIRGVCVMVAVLAVGCVYLGGSTSQARAIPAVSTFERVVPNLLMKAGPKAAKQERAEANKTLGIGRKRWLNIGLIIGAVVSIWALYFMQHNEVYDFSRLEYWVVILLLVFVCEHFFRANGMEPPEIRQFVDNIQYMLGQFAS